MKSFNKILEDALNNVTNIEKLSLGAEDSIYATVEDKDRLLAQINQDSGNINMMIIFIIFLHFLLFALTVYFIFYYRDSINVVFLLLGGSGCSLMVIIYSLIRLLKIKNAINLMRITFPYLSPKDAIMVVKSIYFDSKRNKWSF